MSDKRSNTVKTINITTDDKKLTQLSFLSLFSSVCIRNLKEIFYIIYDYITILYGFIYVYIHIRRLNNKTEN
jgi:hypothetical protein